MQRTITMTEKELERSKAIHMANEKRLTQTKGAQRLKISERHFRRLLRRYREKGDAGLVSGHRGKPSNNRMWEEKRQSILDLMLTTYQGFGPTLASEKLAERDRIQVSKETLRQILMEEGLHRAKTKKKGTAHPLRERRACRGELVQIDGSYHAWLEDRAEEACLLLFVDDATSQILAAQFVPHESFFAYAELCKTYFADIGRPQAFYTDKFSVFRVNAPNVTTTEVLTQFGRAMHELGIEIICANTPQAKGRVERANGTFQDRLVKEMRLEHISNYEQANAFLPTFIAAYNRKFAVLSRSSIDAHIPLGKNCDLDWILSWQDSRIISKDLQIQFKKVIYQIITDRPAYALRNRAVIVAQNADGQITAYLNRKPLDLRIFHRQPKQASVLPAKYLGKPYIPPADHPWRSYGNKINGTPVLAPD